MNNLICAFKSTIKKSPELPFAVYSSIKEQRLLNVPIAKPLFIAVLSGDKKLGKDNEIVCHSGDFIFCLIVRQSICVTSQKIKNTMHC